MGGWHPGDLSPSGIGFTICYLALAGACFVIAYRQDGGPKERRRSLHRLGNAVWNVLGAALVIVAIERQLGLFDLVTDLMRARAEIAGDYAFRYGRQARILKATAITAVLIAFLLAVLAGRVGRCAALLAIMVTAMVAYLIVKAVSLHAVDQILFRHVVGIAVGNWIELALVGAAAAFVMLALAASKDDRRYPRRGR